MKQDGGLSQGNRPLTKTDEFIEQWHKQNDELSELIEMFKESIHRIDGIANKINSADYPKNHPKVVAEDCGKIVKDDETEGFVSDGIIGTFYAISRRRRALLRSFRKDILDDLLNGINYLEQHI